MNKLVLLIMVQAVGCESAEDAHKRHEREAYEAPCKDVSWLLATTSGSPSTATCPNKHHRMRVQVASMPSHEEAAALVFCECQAAPAGSQ